MAQDLLKDGEGRFFRGNLHCHSNRSDGLVEPEAVVAAYRNAGYDFVCLSDHFEAEFGWQITDTRSLRDDNFTTIVGAELSSARWDERDCYWVAAVGLPVDFEAPPADDHAEAIERAGDLGAFVIMLHPGLNNLPLAVAEGLPALETSEAYAISLTGGGDRWQSAEERNSTDGEPITEAVFDLTPFRGSYCRITVVDAQGRRAWGNPIWP